MKSKNSLAFIFWIRSRFKVLRSERGRCKARSTRSNNVQRYSLRFIHPSQDVIDTTIRFDREWYQIRSCKYSHLNVYIIIYYVHLLYWFLPLCLFSLSMNKILQNPGEFILSFSGTFHSGFNCGVNINEAINFGSDGWLNFIDTYTECTCEWVK